MNKDKIKSQLKDISLSFFRKDFFSIYHGSISAKTEASRFIINKKDAIFDNLSDDSLIELYFKKDYRWNQASSSAIIHKEIYENFSDAKFISFSVPIFTMSYSLNHNIIIPKDYFGYKELGNITIYNPKQFDDWAERASTEIVHYFITNKTNIMIIKGYGVYSFNRDISEMVKKLSILERSCRILMLDNNKDSFSLD